MYFDMRTSKRISYWDKIATYHYFETQAHQLQGTLRCICFNCAQFNFMSKSPSKPVCTIQNINNLLILVN